MPVRKVQEGKWFWGSKGPFPTEAKAREVEKAAYASGYRGEDKERAHPKSKGHGK